MGARQLATHTTDYVALIIIQNVNVAQTILLDVKQVSKSIKIDVPPFAVTERQANRSKERGQPLTCDMKK